MFPVSFDQCAGWLHPAAGERGVVICGSFGFEDLCSHKALAVLAEKIAEAGQPAIRFDYRGCGDSAGELSDADLLTTWKHNIRAAAEMLKQRTGVTEIAFVGLRLGAALASEVAAEMGGAAKLALIAPIAAGRSYVREMKALSRVIAVQENVEPGELSLAGFRLSPGLIDAITRIDPTTLETAPAPAVLALGRDSLAGFPALSRLSTLGCYVETGVFDGYDSMICDPTASRVPYPTLDRIASWIVDGALTEGARPVHRLPATITDGGWAESTVLFGKDRALSGVWCRSPNGTPTKAVVILNTGAIHHVGWARASVELARRFATSGVATFRIDVGGIGDSFAAPSGAADSLYVDSLKADISAALDWIVAQGVRDISLLGACSGAYQALQASLADERVRRVALVNQLCYVWGAAYAMQLSAWRATKATVVNAALQDEEGEARDSARVLGGLLPIAKKFAKGSLNALMSLSARASTGDGNVVEDAFRALSERGVEVAMIHSEGDPGLVELERWLGPEGIRAMSLKGVRKHIVPNADHQLTQREARETVGSLIFDLIGVEEKKAEGAEAPAASEKVAAAA